MLATFEHALRAETVCAATVAQTKLSCAACLAYSRVAFKPAPSCYLLTNVLRCMCVGRGNAQSGLRKIWSQCACECLALYLLAGSTSPAPVFGGDLSQHIIVHSVPGDVDTWHVAQSTPEQQDLAVQGMRNLLQAKQDQVRALLEGGLLCCTGSRYDGFCSLSLCRRHTARHAHVFKCELPSVFVVSTASATNMHLYRPLVTCSRGGITCTSTSVHGLMHLELSSSARLTGHSATAQAVHCYTGLHVWR